MAHPVSAGLTTAEGRRFGLTVGVAFLALAALAAWREHASVATTLGLLGALLSIAGLVVPQRLGPVQRGWIALAVAVSRVTTPILMGVVYFLVITPTGILRRTLGRNPLRPRAERTLWFIRSSENRGDLTRQF